MPDDPAGTAAPPPAPAREPRQRWRLVVARDADASAQGQRDTGEAWERAVQAAGLPIAMSTAATPRPRISFGAPLPVGVGGEAELIDLVLVERWPAWRLRAALEPVLPAGWRLISLEDVWLGGPPLAGRVAAADYRVEVEGVTEPDRLRAACQVFLAARSVPRERRKGEGIVRYDLRPLVMEVAVSEAGPPVVLRVRTRFDPERGTGRPEEVVGALGELIGEPLSAGRTTRARLLLAEDLERGR